MLLLASATGFQLRVCTGKVCKKQGSPQVAKFGQDLQLPAVEVQTCACLGECGNGPNVAVIPLDTRCRPLVLKYVGTPRRMAELLRDVCGQEGVGEALLKATELRLAGNAAARDGKLKKAAQLYTQGLELQPPAGRHLLLSNRSGVRLEMGDGQGALEDANEAAQCAPPSFTTATIRQVEALLALQAERAAMACLLAARERQPEFGQSKDYQRTEAKIEAALAKSGA